MDRKLFINFLGDYESMIAQIESGFWGPCEDVAKAAYGATVAKKIAQMATMGLVLDGMCERVDMDIIRTTIHKVIRKVIGPIRQAIVIVNATMAQVVAVQQAWEAIPSLEEYSDVLLKQFESQTKTAIEAAIPTLIETLACGTKFELKCAGGLKQILTASFIQPIVLTAAKTTWEKYEAAQNAN